MVFVRSPKKRSENIASLTLTVTVYEKTGAESCPPSVGGAAVIRSSRKCAQKFKSKSFLGNMLSVNGWGVIKNRTL